MQREIDRYLTLLERRLATLRQLATQIKESQVAYTAMDLDRITYYINLPREPVQRDPVF